MNKRIQVVWFGALGLFLLVGLIITLTNLSSTNYYQKQVYNNLPSLVEQPIQHYQEQVEKSVEATEQHITEQNLPEGSNVVVNTGDNVNIAMGGNNTQSLTQFFNYRHSDGSSNLNWVIILVVSLAFVFYHGLAPFPFWITKYNIPSSLIAAITTIYTLSLILSTIQP